MNPIVIYPTKSIHKHPLSKKPIVCCSKVRNRNFQVNIESFLFSPIFQWDYDTVEIMSHPGQGLMPTLVTYVEWAHVATCKIPCNGKLSMHSLFT